MSDYSRPAYYDENQQQPTARQAVKFVTAATIGITLLLLSALTLTGTVIALIVATPLLVLFSPILVPAGIAVFLAASGFVFSGSCGIAAIAALSWIYNYVTGKHPAGSFRFDNAAGLIGDKARDVKERAKDFATYAPGRAQEAIMGHQAYASSG
ncbi:hypothetical protein K1719_022278 [Acacia pycnantha]|nr:hypothetical protein K1719_022278 [Acacia pycnantha]